MKRIRIPFTLIVILFIAILGITTVNASPERDKKANTTEEEKIREVINKYFEIRYQSRAVNRVADLNELIDNSLQANSFLNSETDKLEVEIHNAKLHNLGFAQYKYTLDFNSISIDKDNLSATVLLTEGHDIIFEISTMVSKTDPIVSKMRGLDHTIVLRKTQTGWKIVSDQYNDLLWRTIKATNLSKAELLQTIDHSYDQSLSLTGLQSLTFSCNLQADTSIHSYDRTGAIAYARKYALNPNLNYHFFEDADCTNFVNQSIHHGSNAEEVGSGTYGWYYNYYNSGTDNDYSASWTDVGQLYNFIQDYLVWSKGPEGCVTDQNNAMPGDLVQFEWLDDGDTVWDHTVIIVIRGTGGSGYQYWVSGHTDNIDAYPLDNIIYEDRRFVHIERIDGYANLHMPLILNQSSGYLKSAATNPYPAPMEAGVFNQSQMTPIPYPAP